LAFWAGLGQFGLFLGQFGLFLGGLGAFHLPPPSPTQVGNFEVQNLLKFPVKMIGGFGQVWAGLGRFGQVWAGLSRFEQV
jgi:hypothetical protein